QRRNCQAAATAGCGAVAGEQGGETEVRGAEPRTRQDLPARHGESDGGRAATSGRDVEEAERQVSHPPLRPWETFPAPPPFPWESTIIPRFTAPPVGMGNREWGIGEEDLPTPHPTAFFSPPPHPASSFPIPTIPHSRLPIPTGVAGGDKKSPPVEFRGAIPLRDSRGGDAACAQSIGLLPR